MSDQEHKKVVISRRSEDDIVWDTRDGFSNFTLTPFGIVGNFEGKKIVTVFIPWSDVTLLEVYDETPSDLSNPIICPDCQGKGLLDEGLTLCSKCDGYGYQKREEQLDELENG